MNDPVDNIVWLQASELVANDYNPNHVDRRELRLLERSIMKTGWIQPLLISRDNIIIDGFHRWGLARHSELLQQRYGGRVPCAILDVSPAEAMAITVRINRAKGTHAAVEMSALVHRLVNEYAWDEQEVALEIGATLDEVQLLLQDNIFKARNIAEYQYSRAWVPEETGKP